jgi:YVTN family beta-propeller protein
MGPQRLQSARQRYTSRVARYSPLPRRHQWDLAGRAALLGGIWLTALTLLVPGAALAQQGPFVYVPNLNDSDVSVIDTPTNTVAPAVISAGLAPLAAAVRAVAQATSIYLRHDGAIGSGNDNHTLNIGARITW